MLSERLAVDTVFMVLRLIFKQMNIKQFKVYITFNVSLFIKIANSVHLRLFLATSVQKVLLFEAC